MLERDVERAAARVDAALVPRNLLAALGVIQAALCWHQTHHPLTRGPGSLLDSFQIFFIPADADLAIKKLVNAEHATSMNLASGKPRLGASSIA